MNATELKVIFAIDDFDDLASGDAEGVLYPDMVHGILGDIELPYGDILVQTSDYVIEKEVYSGEPNNPARGEHEGGFVTIHRAMIVDWLTSRYVSNLRQDLGQRWFVAVANADHAGAEHDFIDANMTVDRSLRELIGDEYADWMFRSEESDGPDYPHQTFMMDIVNEAISAAVARIRGAKDRWPDNPIRVCSVCGDATARDFATETDGADFCPAHAPAPAPADHIAIMRDGSCPDCGQRIGDRDFVVSGQSVRHAGCAA